MIYQGPSGWNQVASDTPVYEVLNSRGGYINGSIGLGWSTLTSISAYERVDYREAEDDDGSPYAVGGFQAEDLVSQYSQELRLAGKQGPFDWVAGLYYYTDRLEQETYAIAFTDPIFVGTPLEPFAAISTNSPTQSSHNQAVFADLRYAFNPQWTLDLGARYTHESKHVLGRAELNYPGFDTGFFPTIGGPGLPDSNLNKSWSSPTGRVALEWRPVKDIMAYASWSRGFKSGGFNGLAANSVTELTPYNPETDNTYELGVKTGWLDGRLTANAAVFHNKIKNLQALEVVTENNITYFFVRNAASGTSKGAEFELRAQPGGGWTFSAGVGLLNTRYDSYVIANGPDYSGEEFVNAPKVNGDVMAQYSFPLLGGKLGPEVDYSYVGFRWTDNPHRPGIDGIPGYGLLDASIPWTTGDGRFQVSLWGQNLGNKHYFITTVGNDFLTAGAAGSYHGLPRTYGIRFAYNYR